MRVAFYKGPGSPYTWIIRKVTQSPYSHAELVMPSGARITVLAQPGVVRLAPFRPEELKDWDFVELPETAVLRVHDAQVFFEEESSAGYDWTGIIFTQLFPAGWESKHNWFCSEFVTEALKRMGILPKSLKSASVCPGELHDRLTRILR